MHMSNRPDSMHQSMRICMRTCTLAIAQQPVDRDIDVLVLNTWHVLELMIIAIAIVIDIPRYPAPCIYMHSRSNSIVSFAIAIY